MKNLIKEGDQQEFRLKTLEFNVEQLQQKSDETIIVNTHCGKIKGIKRRTIYDDNYYSFERIPYAQPPVGELRFRAPKPATAWKDVLDCTHYAARPMQRYFMYDRIEGSEDCLYLNVYTNDMKPAKQRPVMVWIYGGGYTFGEATREWYGPDYFMKTDVILVTLQYRLGALGFLSLDDPKLHVPGNAGLKDQILALKWIKRNCANFGGNPDCITLFGESAGGESTHLLMLTDQTKGLFHRAIAQSGVATSDWSTIRCTKHAFALAKAAGYEGSNQERKILNFLLDCDAETLVKATENCLATAEKQNLDSLAFGPTIEPYLTPHTVLAKAPADLLKHAWSNDIPFMLGGTSNEGLMLLPTVQRFPALVEQIMENCIAFVPRQAAPNRNSPECLEKGLKLRRAYVTGQKPTPAEFYDIISHSYFWHPIGNTIHARLQHAKKSSTFLYRFDFDSDNLIYPFRFMRWGRAIAGVGHADELSYLFSNVMSRRMPLHSREYRTIERMIGLWTRFAETGNPNGGKINDMKNIKWRPLQKDANAAWKCLNIGDKLEFIDLPEMDKLRLWQSLYSMHRDFPKRAAAVESRAYVKSSL